MFGYIRVSEGDLRINDYGIYKGVYCGLCKTMKKYTGSTSCLSLSYDFVFLALLRSAMNNEGFKVSPGRCGLHPIKKRPVSTENEALKYCAGASAVLTYYKLLDDKNDKDTKKRLAVRSALPSAKKNLKRAIKNLPEYKFDVLSEQVSEHLSRLSELENEGCQSADLCADIFGKLLGCVFSHGLLKCDAKSTCFEIGYRLGRYIYLIDVLDDFESDKKSGAYNPLIAAGFSECPDDFIVASLSRENREALSALNSLNISFADINNILTNILDIGLPTVLNKIFEKKTSENK